ncbi:DHHC palmitoyltransferase-domain-containing protein [Mycena albidolilacea]|uniref:Palmitoyltransferase n=1 Tax=Mycena albidolilacea TaxID=1033008 RepID=A0AAD6ZYB6_9AGAR|nr:DHHC palmitoyltransferase-domain-containing protein [Mycena albidolilacea]
MASGSKSPIMPTFAVPYRSTHAGGIQPSASFFRPSRPQYRAPSVESEHQHPTDADVYNLAPLDKTFSNSSDEEYKLQRPKPSREPLISLARPPILRDRSGSGSTGPLSPSRGSRIMRNSLERVLGLRRGMSFESLHKSGGAREGRPPPFEGKPTDEEHGMFDLPPASPAPGDFSSSAQHTPSASPTPSFSAPPPPRGPPRDAMPILDPTTHKPLRNYQLHPSRNRFFLDGRIMTGGDSPWAFVGSFSLLLTIGGVWFGTTAVWWWHNKSPAVAAVSAYVTLITVASMLATATRDPGILPRNLDPDPPYPATSPSDGGMRAPMPRDLKVRADVVRVKYCPTCKTYRPPRSSHCKMCDNCVDGCDHHCQWVNNCIGRRNYTTFFVLLLSATLALFLMVITAALHLYWLSQAESAAGTPRKHVFEHALRHGAGSAVVFCLGIIVIWPVGALLSYHMRLLLLNITTIEQIRNQAHKTLVPGPAPPNPFSHGTWRRNLLQVLCRPVGFSALDAHGLATQDEREVNPGLGHKEQGGKERRIDG